MGGRGGAPMRAQANAPAAPTAAPPGAPPTTAPQSLETQIQEAIRSLEEQPNGLVSLVRLRDRMSGVERATLDSELKRLDRARIIQLDPEPNQKVLTQEMRRAGITLGSELKMLVSRIGRS